MNRNSNTYTIIYSTALVILVAVVLTLAAYLLKDKQQRNIEIETQQSILKSVHLDEGANQAPDKAKFIEERYSKYIKDTVITIDGESSNVDKPNLFICTLDSGEKIYVIPVKGAGLWGPIWGYVALKDDMNTIYGTIFDHKGETPGLGAEISTPAFSKQFENKKILDDNGNFISIAVLKGGAGKNNPHGVDAISGGTITSKGLEAMLKNSLVKYIDFFKSKLKK